MPGFVDVYNVQNSFFPLFNMREKKTGIPVRISPVPL
jgi:hypothetical protein